MLTTLPRYLVLTGVLFLLGFRAHGQDYPSRHFTVADGLPSNTVYNLYFDSQGFLWVLTDKGVARYNGLKFQKFTTFNGLADNEIFFAEEDLYNRLWFATYNGNLCYFQNDTFHNPDNTPFLRRKGKHSYTYRIFPQADSSVLVCFLGADYFCDISKDTCLDRKWSFDRSLGKDACFVEKTGSSGFKIFTEWNVIWLDTKNSPGAIEVEKRPKNLVYASRAQNQPWRLFYDSASYSINFQDRRNYPPGVTYSQTAPRELLTDESGNSFQVTAQGIFLNDNIRILEKENTTCIAQDRHKNYWVSTLGNGIFCFSRHFMSSEVFNKAYSGKVVYATEIKNKLFFSTNDQKFCLLDKAGTKCLFSTNYTDIHIRNSVYFLDTNFTCYYFRGGRNFVISNILEHPLKVKTYNYHIATERQALKKIIRCDDWIYLNAGFDLRGFNLNDYSRNDSVKYTKASNLNGDRIFAFAHSSDNVVWYSTIDSVYKLQNGIGVAQPQFDKVSFKTFDFFGRFLVGISHENQLLVYETFNGKVKKHQVRGECVWENLYGIDSNHVLISTNGLYYLLRLDNNNADTPYCISAIENAILPQPVEAICMGEADCYFFQGGNITKVKKSELLEKPYSPVLHFAYLRTANKQYRIDRSIELPYNESRNISLSFASLSYDATDLITQYSISENETDNWVNMQGDINMANQPYGTYTIKIRGRTLSSDFSAPAVFKITILRPFWATWWFLSTAICLLAMAAWFIVKWRLRATVLKKEKEHENHVRFIKSEYKAMNALMNPHFVFNSINNVQSLVNDRDVLNATEYLGVFADLIRQNMHNISNDVIPLQKEIDLVENYLLLEKLRFEDKLNYSINIAENAFLTDIMVPPLLLQPLVENSIKHGILPLKSQGREGHVAINIFEEDDNLFIEVVDNGIGITKARQKRSLHESYGLANIKNRVQQLSIILGKEMSFELSEVFDDDGRPEGTKAIICIPIG